MREKIINSMEWTDRGEWGRKIKLLSIESCENIDTLYINKINRVESHNAHTLGPEESFLTAHTATVITYVEKVDTCR